MPFRAQIQQARQTLIYALGASAAVSCFLSLLLIRTINSASLERARERRMVQAIKLSESLERMVLRQRSGLTNLSQFPRRIMERSFTLAASGLDIARVYYYGRDGGLLYSSHLQRFDVDDPADSTAGIRKALQMESSGTVEHSGDLWYLRVFVPLHNRENVIIGALQILIDITQSRAMILRSNQQSLYVAISLFFLSTVVLYLIGNAFIQRMGEAIRARAKSEEELERSQELARVGLMVSGLSHQLRNPLSILNGIVGALNRRPAMEEQRPFLAALTEETARIIKLSEIFLDFAKPIRSEANENSVREVIRQLEDFLKQRVPHAKVTVLGSPTMRWRFDRELLFQALVNISLNSIEAVPAGQPPEIILTYGASKGALSIQIADNGPGFDEEQLEQLGTAPQPFYSTKAKGSGLGLAIADKIAGAHGGRIEFSNGSSGGARVTLIIPAA